MEGDLVNLHSQISLDNFVLNLSRGDGKGISFKQGEIVKGQVHDIKGNGLISIYLKGRLIEAATEVLVSKGQELFLLVDDMKDGQVFLRVLTPELLSKIENTNIAANLREIGINAGDNNIQMAKKLIQHNLPVTKDTLENMARGINILGGSTPRNLEVVGLAMAQNVPLTPQSLTTLVQFVDGKVDLAQVSKELMKIVNKLNQIAGMAKNSTIPTPESRANQNITVKLDTPEKDTRSLRTAVSNPVPQSSTGSVSLTAISQQATGSPIQLTGKLSSSVYLNNFLPLLNQLLENVIIPFDIETERTLTPTSSSSQVQKAQVNNILSSFRSHLANNNDFIRGLALIKEILVHKEIPGLEKTIINNLLNSIEKMEGELTGQRLFNVMTKFTGDSNLNYYYLSFPIKVEEEYRLCQLKIDKKLASQALIEKDNVKIVVSLETSNLGYVLFHVDWYKNGLLKLQGVVESEKVSNYVSTQIDSLIKAIESRNYTVDYQGIKIASGAEEMRVKLEEVDEIIKPYVIDIRV